MTHWTQDPEKVQAAKLKRQQTLQEKREKKAAREAKKQEPVNGAEESQQSMAVKARWAGEKASENELNQLVAQISMEEALQMLAKMRHNCEIVAVMINNRITGADEVAKCETCKGSKAVNRQWALIRPQRDPNTQLVRNLYYCSIACVALENKQKQGVYGVQDRGMLHSDNAKPVA